MTPIAHDCDQFQEACNQALDTGATLPLAPIGCEPCNNFSRVVHEFNRWPTTTPSPDFASSTVAALRTDYQKRRRGRRVQAGLVLVTAASIFLAFRPTQSTPEPQVASTVTLTPTPAPAPPELREFVTEAQQYWAALGERAREISSPTWPSLNAPVPPAPTDTLAHLPAAAKSGLAPLANTTRRAFSVFLRDTGLGPTS